MIMFGFAKEELRVIRKLRTPVKIQDFVNALAPNFEEQGDTLMSPRRVLRERKAHCMEGALLAAAALWVGGAKPLLLDLKTVPADDYHVVALFRKRGCWGAISKTNHAVLRYREPVYRSIRELAMSYFHEYFLNKNGKKTLRSFSKPLDLSRFAKRGWTTDEEDLWYVYDALDKVPHKQFLTQAMIAGLRRADPIEIEAGKLVEKKRL